MTRSPGPAIPKTGSRSTLRGLAALSAAALAIFVLFSQALAVMPMDWLNWALHIKPAQALMLHLGRLRDDLGVWNVCVAAMGAALAVFVLTTGARRSWEKPLALSSLLGLTSTIATTVVLLVAVGRIGVAAFPLLPGVPFAAVNGPPDKTVVFGQPQGIELHADLYLVAGAHGGLHPVVVNIHGGGFAFSGRGPTAYTRFLADHGYVVMDIDYRLASKDYHAWKSQVADVGCALAWIKTHAGEYAMDPERVATFGESSGGNLAINAAYMANNGTLEPACGAATDIPRVKAVIGGYPAVDLTRGTRSTAIGRVIGQYYVGGPPEQYPAIYARLDSATHISAHSPPTLIFQGSHDTLVLAQPVRDFADLLTARGVVNSYVEYPGLDHGCGDSNGILTYGTAASRLLILRWLEMYLQA